MQEQVQARRRDGSGGGGDQRPLQRSTQEVDTGVLGADESCSSGKGDSAPGANSGRVRSSAAIGGISNGAHGRC
jgi:hypothetical protein